MDEYAIGDGVRAKDGPMTHQYGTVVFLARTMAPTWCGSAVRSRCTSVRTSWSRGRSAGPRVPVAPGPGRQRPGRREPDALTCLSGGFAVIGDVQFLPGYSANALIVAGVDRLSDLPRSERAEFLTSMDLLGEAVERVCSARDAAFRRVNLEILGNTDAFLHAHVWPRYDWEPADIVTKPVWSLPRRAVVGSHHAALQAARRPARRAHRGARGPGGRLESSEHAEHGVQGRDPLR